MIKILKKFFDFSGEENKRKFYRAMLLGVVIAFIQAMRVPAAYIVVKGLLEGNLTGGTAWLSCGIIAGSVLISSAISMKATMLQTEAGFNAATKKRIEIAEHLRYIPMGYFNDQSLGQIASVATTTMETLGNIGTRVTMVVSKGYLTTGMIVLLLFFFDVRVALIALCGIAVFLLLSAWMQKATAHRSAIKLDADEALTGKVLEYVQGIAEVKNYNLVSSKTTEVDAAVDAAASANIELEIVSVIIIFLQNSAVKLTGAAMMLSSIAFYLNGSMQLAECIMMIICSFMIFEALDQAGSYSSLLKALEICVDKGNDVLSSPTMDIEGKELAPEHFDLAMEHVDFAYGTRKIIDDVSLTVPERKLTAFVGPSGSGKTTVTQLLARFWDADKGSVTLGGTDVREYSYDSLMKNYAFVFQSVYLFQDTIAANIAFGMPDASREAITEAAKKACCHEFISALPDGYDTVIGEGGATLSGGEKQRISIARAIMKDAPVIILDEATANVDPENEAELVRAIEALTSDKTVIMIAHRLKTVRGADQIFVLDRGRIVQQGKHEELIQQEGIYRSFVKDRSQAISWGIAQQ